MAQVVIRVVSVLARQLRGGTVAIENREMDFPRTVRLAPKDLNDPPGVRHRFGFERIV